MTFKILLLSSESQSKSSVVTGSVLASTAWAGPSIGPYALRPAALL
jgi:hypothetical protein